MTASQYEKMVSALTNAGVSLRDSEGAYRSTYDIIKDIAAVWDQLSSTEQAALSQTAAGTRMQNIWSSLVTQFKEASDAMDAMSDSTGALNKSYNTYLDSIEGRTAQLTASFQALSKSLFNADWFKSLITSITRIVDSLTLLLGVGDGIAIKGLGFIALAAILSKIVPQIIGWYTSVRAATLSATTATSKFQAVCNSLNLNPYVVAIMAVVAALKLLYDWTQKANYSTAYSKVSESTDKYKELDDKISDLNSKLRDTDSKISDLKAKGTLTLLEEAELSRLTLYNEQLKLTLSTVNSLKTSQIKIASNDFTNAVKAFNNNNSGDNSFWDFLIYGNQSIRNKWFIPGVAEKTQQFDRNNKSYKELYDEAMSKYKKYSDVKSSNYNEDAAAQAYSDLTTIIGKAQELRDTVADIGYQDLDASAKEMYDMLDAMEVEYVAATDTAQAYFDTVLNQGKYQQAVRQLTEAAKDGELTTDEIRSLSQDYQSVADLVREIDDRFGGGVTSLKEHFSKSTSDAAKSLDIAQRSVSDLKEEVENLGKQITNIKSAYDTVSDAIEEFNTYGALSADTISELIALEPEYLNLLIDESGQLNLNSDSYNKLYQAKLKDLLLSQIKTTLSSILQMDEEKAAAYAAAEAYNAETDSLNSLVAAEFDAAYASAALKDATNNTTTYTDAIKRYATVVPSLISLVNSAQVDAAKSTEIATDVLEDQKEALEDQKDALEELKDTWEDYKDEISDAKDDIQDLIDLVSDYIKQTKEDEKDALEERKDAFDDLIDKEKEELEVKKEASEFADRLRDKQNAYAKDALAASIASLDDSAAGKKAYKEANDNLIESRGDLYDELADHEYDVRVDALEKLQETMDDYYDKEIDKIDKYLDDERQIYNDACSLIENDTGDLYDTLWAYTYKYTTKTRAEFDYLWTSAQEALEKYNVAQLGVIGVMNFLYTEFYKCEAQIDDLDKSIDTLDKKIDTISESIEDLSDKSINKLTTSIQNLKSELSDLENIDSAQWYYWFRGQRFESFLSNRADAVQDLLAKVQNAFSDSPYVSDIYGGIQHYAKGTYGAHGGPSVVNEQGHEIRVLNKGDGILTAKITRNLSNLGSDPVSFLADAGKKLLSKIGSLGLFGKPVTNPTTTYAVSNGGDMPITITNHINGDINPSTLKALEKAQKDITQNAINGMMKMTLGLRNSSRVR